MVCLTVLDRINHPICENILIWPINGQRCNRSGKKGMQRYYFRIAAGKLTEFEFMLHVMREPFRYPIKVGVKKP